MSRSFYKAVVPFLAIGFLSTGCSWAGTSPVVWIAPSLQAVGLNDPSGSLTLAQIWAARGESESFQIVVKAQSGSLSNVNVSVSDLTGPAGFHISNTLIELYREHYSNVSPGSPDWGGTNRPLGAGSYADGLIPFIDPATGKAPSGGSLIAAPFSVNSGQNQPIWVDVSVPRSAPAGNYSGTYNITSSSGSVTGTIILTVWNFQLPETPALASSFAWSRAQTLGSTEEVLRHRITPIAVNPADEQQLMTNYGLTDASLGFWSGAYAGHCVMSTPPSASQLSSAIQSHHAGLPLFNFTADEVDNCPNLYPTIQQWGLALHKAGTKQLVTMQPVPQLMDDGSGTGRSAVDIWVMLPLMYTAAGSEVATVLAKGDTVWSANTLVQDAYSPKWEIDFHPADFRLQPGFISQSLQFKGLLYWRLDNWISDPWTNVNNVGAFGTNNYPGEGYFVYPGADVGTSGVVPSIRLKRLRDGVDDFDYIDLLKKAGQGSWALQIAKSVAPDWTNWTRDGNQIEAARLQLGQELDRLASPPPSTPASPSPANAAVNVSVTPTLSWTETGSAVAYDIHFGTTSNPPLFATTTTTQYKPGNLTANQKYYWSVVARNAAGVSSSSPIWSFTTQLPQNQPPQTVSATPSSGTGTSATLSLAYSDPNGYKTINGVNLLIGASQAGAHSCWVYFDQVAGGLFLADDSGSSWSSMALGSTGTLSNSQCKISGSSLSITGSGNSLSVHLGVNFTSTFAGNKLVFMNAIDSGGLSSGYTEKGTWTVPSH